MLFVHWRGLVHIHAQRIVYQMIYIYIYRDLEVELSVRSLVIRDLSLCFVLCCARSQVWEAVKSGRLSGLWSGRLNIQEGCPVWQAVSSLVWETDLPGRLSGLGGCQVSSLGG